MLVAHAEGPPVLVAAGVYWDLGVRGVVLLAVAVILGLVVAWVRRWRSTAVGSAGEPWTLQDLRELHRAGTLSDEEFERLKAGVIGLYNPPEPASRPDESAPGDVQG